MGDGVREAPHPPRAQMTRVRRPTNPVTSGGSAEGRCGIQNVIPFKRISIPKFGNRGSIRFDKFADALCFIEVRGRASVGGIALFPALFRRKHLDRL